MNIKILGDFGPARKEVIEAAGGISQNYNVQCSGMGGIMKNPGILSEDGTKIHVWGGFSQSLDCLALQSADDLKKLGDDREDNENLSSAYKIQPENQGKLIWLSGPPGAGKSTTGHLLAKTREDYVYYEADCAMGFTNPFIDPKAEGNPSLLATSQNPIKV